MNYKKAHKIIKSKKGISIATNDWMFIKEADYMLIFSVSLDFRSGVSFSEFLDHYVLSGKFNIKDNLIIGEYLYSSIGLITQDDYFLAEDLIQNSEFIPFKELESNYFYRANNGKTYLYVNNIGSKLLSFNKLTGDFFKEDEYMNYLIEMKGDTFGKIIKYRSDIKLIEKKECFDDKEFIKNYILENKNIYFDEIDDIKVIMRYMGSGDRKVYSNPFMEVPDNICIKEIGEYFWKVEDNIVPNDADIVKVEASYSWAYGFFAMRVNKFKFVKDLFLFLNSNDRVYNVRNAFYDDEYYEIIEDDVPF